jgi:hypothetical protein
VIGERCYEASRELVECPLSRGPRRAPLTTRPRAQDNNTRAYGLLHRLAEEENLPDAQFNLGCSTRSANVRCRTKVHCRAQCTFAYQLTSAERAAPPPQRRLGAPAPPPICPTSPRLATRCYYADGIGVARDDVAARRFFKRAASGVPPPPPLPLVLTGHVSSLLPY